MDYCYYILPDAISTAKGDLTVGERIFAVPTTHPIIEFAYGEGPYFNLKMLEQQSEIFAKLKKSNPKRAHNIVQEKYISKIENYLLIPKDTNLDPKIIEIWQHVVRGDEKSNGVSGVHFYDKKFIKIIEVLDKNNNGVLLARIEARFDENENWIARNDPTTLFPISWSIQQLSIELDFALKNRIKEEGSLNRYRGKTYSGIETIFIIVAEKVKTAYPIL
ncbi:Bacterial EndoU nuclease [Flavobacteriaceae bacterium]|jgi:hypothetical protein